jgi:hypothetical protein
MIHTATLALCFEMYLVNGKHKEMFSRIFTVDRSGPTIPGFKQEDMWLLDTW